jgi:hypothetical protein
LEGTILNARERIMAALTWGEPDFVPWTSKPTHLPRGLYERRLRSMGMGLTLEHRVFSTSIPEVTVRTISRGDYVTRVYETPVGEVQERLRVNLPSEGGERSERWRVEHFIKEERDYRVIEYIFENMQVKPIFEDFRRAVDDLGGDGIVLTSLGYTPFMDLLINYMGIKKLAYEVHRNRRRLEAILEVMAERKREICRVIADSPAEMVLLGDNIDEVLIGPKLFERYCLPFYQEYSEILHRSGKIVGSHMDGRLKRLKGLIKESGLDFLHGFTPPPVGNLPVREAREAWDRKISLWLNVPETTFYDLESLGSYVRGLLREAAPGDGFMLGITETVPPALRNRAYMIIMETVLKYGRYPIGGNA